MNKVSIANLLSPTIETAVAYRKAIVACEGVVQSVYPRKTGKMKNPPNRDYSFQDLILADVTDPSKTFRATFNNRPEVPKTAEGKTIQLLCDNNAQHGFVGVKLRDDEYKDKQGQPVKTTVLWVTYAAHIVGLDGNYDGGEKSQPTAPVQPAGQPEAEPLPVEPQPALPVNQHSHPTPHDTTRDPSRGATVAKPNDDVLEAAELSKKITNLLLLSAYKVKTVVDRYTALTDEVLSPEYTAGWVGIMFIESAKVGLVHKMPTDPIEQFLPKRKPAQ